ncbi:AAA family ATPase [Nocardioides pocheonensis]|uniref:AAA family ATPase n=2 Tax=Nocardioides pocheonensis TaxID=661485 RepID=A0A3N0GZE4_9ACTN|nr:AAA family ATPase [Nocardioides pocheonensis]
MRARTESLDSAAAGDWVSREFLEAAFAERRKALADDPTVPLFFGRVDYRPDAPDVGGESLHVGRRHITDERGDPMVVDWRAPVSRAFYRASRSEPLGLALRRRYGFVRGRLTGFEDEAFGEARPSGAAQVEDEYSALLEAEIERPRVGPMRDIVATIQPEQDVIVRADLSRSVCVQGAPGTGKTAVGLHRAAYLLYAHRDQLSRQGVLVVGPNASFLRYIGDVLPALGEMAVGQTTIEELVATTLRHAHAKATVRGSDPAPVSVLKGDARMAEVLSRAVWSHLVAPTEGLVVPRGAARWRVPAYEVEETIATLRSREVRYAAARAMLAQRLAHAVLVKMENAGDSPDDRVQDAVARSRPVKQYVDAVWPAVDPARVVLRLLSDPDFLATAADGLLSADEQRLLLWPKPAKAPGSAPWSLADAVLVDEAHDLVARQPSLGHVVLDEAQDLSAMMLRAVGRRCTTGSATVLGDLAQTTTAWGVGSWPRALAHLGKPDAVVDELTRGFRVPGEVIEYAARLLPRIAPELTPPVSVRRARGELDVVATDPLGALPAAVSRVLERVGSVGLIVPDALVADVVRVLDGHPLAVVGTSDREQVEFDVRLDVVPASLAKGLEFDHVVLVEPAAIAAGEPDEVTGLRRLYVCLTRAVTSLVVLHGEPLPAALR